MRRAIVAAFSVSLATPLAAEAQGFGFEATAVGTYTSLATTSGTQTLTVTALNPSRPFEVRVVPALPLTSFLGTRAIWSAGPTDVGGGLRFSFSVPVGSVTFSLADYLGDDDTPVVVRAYGAGGALLATYSEPYPATSDNLLTIGTGGFGSEGASYFELFSGPSSGAFPNSLYVEIAGSTTISAVPEPGTWALLATGLAGLAGVARRRRLTS